ncbi:MAG: hypothetical protein JO142_10960 [Burkholderiales bacterium]|nr:hypothetical protein [Burkholderiales bacterium]
MSFYSRLEVQYSTEDQIDIDALRGEINAMLERDGLHEDVLEGSSNRV